MLVCTFAQSCNVCQAAIGGVWAALQWPAADVYVATMGEPQPGNRQFGQVRAHTWASGGCSALLEQQQQHARACTHRPAT